MSTRKILHGRVLYPHCFHPSNYYGRSPYSLTLLVPKGNFAMVSVMQEGVQEAQEKALEKWGGKLPSRLQSPIHDGDLEKPDNRHYQNCYYLNIRSKEAPQVVDRHVLPLTNESELYSGCYCNVSVIFYGYNNSGNKGVAAYLGNVQKVKDGTPLRKKIAAIDEFEDLSREVTSIE